MAGSFREFKLMRTNAEFVDQDRFRAAVRSGRSAGLGVERAGRVLRAPTDDSRVVRFVFSDGSVDRMGDRIDPNGWQTADYMRNAVALFAHDSSAPPIGRTIAVWSDGQRLMGDIEFMSADVYPFAETIFRMVQEKYLNAVSVGFIPTEYKWADDEDGREWGINFLRQELVEISIVPVPANANALIDARAKGIISPGDFRRLRAAAPSGWGHMSATEREAALRRVHALRHRLEGAPVRAEVGNVEERDAVEMLALCKRLRRRHGLVRPDPRAVAAEAAFRLRANY